MRILAIGLAVIIGLALAFHYLFGICLVGLIVHKAGKLRRAGQARRDHELWQDAMRRSAGPLYRGVNGPSSSAWYDRAGR